MLAYEMFAIGPPAVCCGCCCCCTGAVAAATAAAPMLAATRTDCCSRGIAAIACIIFRRGPRVSTPNLKRSDEPRKGSVSMSISASANAFAYLDNPSLANHWLTSLSSCVSSSRCEIHAAASTSKQACVEPPSRSDCNQLGASKPTTSTPVASSLSSRGQSELARPGASSGSDTGECGSENSSSSCVSPCACEAAEPRSGDDFSSGDSVSSGELEPWLPCVSLLEMPNSTPCGEYQAPLRRGWLSCDEFSGDSVSSGELDSLLPCASLREMCGRCGRGLAAGRSFSSDDSKLTTSAGACLCSPDARAAAGPVHGPVHAASCDGRSGGVTGPDLRAARLSGGGDDGLRRFLAASWPLPGRLLDDCCRDCCWSARFRFV